eukprot:GDKI01025693.1.p2 GENE.GDKI01025693.1~~GDKI01025693.1.p2  ORF type:complete len:101 (-),score=23.88 GDKI01025693.1:67-369(-)
MPPATCVSLSVCLSVTHMPTHMLYAILRSVACTHIHTPPPHTTFDDALCMLPRYALCVICPGVCMSLCLCVCMCVYVTVCVPVCLCVCVLESGSICLFDF